MYFHIEVEFGEHVCLHGSWPRAIDRFACQSANRPMSVLYPRKRARCLRCELVKSSRDTDDNQCFPISATSNSQPDRCRWWWYPPIARNFQPIKRLSHFVQYIPRILLLSSASFFVSFLSLYNCNKKKTNSNKYRILNAHKAKFRTLYAFNK